MTAFNVSGHRVQPMAHFGIRNCSPTAIKQVQIIYIYIYIYIYMCVHIRILGHTAIYLKIEMYNRRYTFGHIYIFKRKETNCFAMEDSY